MPKINKDTLKTLKNGVKVFKYENKNSYNCYFQVGSTYAKSGKKYYGAMFFFVSSAIAEGFFSNFSIPIPRITLGALVNWISS